MRAPTGKLTLRAPRPGSHNGIACQCAMCRSHKRPKRDPLNRDLFEGTDDPPPPPTDDEVHDFVNQLDLLRGGTP